MCFTSDRDDRKKQQLCIIYHDIDIFIKLHFMLKKGLEMEKYIQFKKLCFITDLLQIIKEFSCVCVYVFTHEYETIV